MRCERYLDFPIGVIVLLVHVMGLSLLFDRNTPELSIGAPAMQLVSLGDLNIGKANLAEAIPVTPIEPPPLIKQQDEILTVKTETEKTDVIKATKPEKSVKQKTNQSKKPKANKIVKSASSNNATKKEGDTSTSAGGEQTGKGQGETTATHLGKTLNNPIPPYPPLSIENRESGRVRLEVVVETNGRPSSVRLIKSSGYPRLDRSALKTVREQYHFKPATRLGIPVKSNYTFVITFDLNQL
ncbi:energy transducer TonB [Testudinibacter sp. P27/CKL/0425]